MPEMRPLFCLWVLLASSVVCPGGVTPAGATQGEERPRPIDSVFVGGDSLSYNGYRVARLKKRVRYDDPQEREAMPEGLEASYVVLKRGGRVLVKFDGLYHGMGNTADFGLFPFLGAGTKQLAVSLTVPRGGRHWVVDLSPAPRVIFDSGDYDVGREEFSVIDIDKDGVYEILLPLTAFYMFESMGMAETPLPEIIFRYDRRARRYVPANPSFQGYILKGIADKIGLLSSRGGSTYLSERLDIVLRYIYAGRETEAWDFFDRKYGLPDREEMKAKIKAVLRDEGAYKYIYGKHP